MTLDTLAAGLRLRLPASMYEGLAQRLRDVSRGAATLKLCEADGA